MRNYLTPIAAAIVAVAVIFPRDAFAYIDPNAPGILYQILFPLIVALTVGWRWIRNLCVSTWKRITRNRE